MSTGRTPWISMHHIRRSLASFRLCLPLLPALLLPVLAFAGNLILDWTAPTTNTDGSQLTDLASYRIYYATGIGACGAASAQTLAAPLPNPVAGTVVSYQLPGLTPGTTYFVQVSAVDTSGSESACSNEVSGAAQADQDTTAPTGAIAINSGAAATNWTAATLTLTATDLVGVTGYYASTSSIKPAATASGWVGVPATPSYSNGTVPFTLPAGDGPKTVYAWYKDAAGNVSATASDTILLDQTAPTNGTLTATASAGQVALSWAGVRESGSGLAMTSPYKLVVQPGSSPAPTCTTGIQLYQGSGTSYTHTGLPNGTAYAYRLCATDAAGNVAAGATASATPQALVSITISTQGKGTGKVTSTPSGIECGATCTASYAYGSTVTLTATAEPGSAFAGWGGACTGTAGCVVTATQARTVTVAFKRAYPFTDEVLVPGTTPVKLVHLSELRTAVNTARSDYGLSAAAWTDPTLTAGKTEVKRAHLTELRTALRQVFAAAGLATPSFTDPTLEPGETPIKAAHLRELRTCLRALP